MGAGALAAYCFRERSGLLPLFFIAFVITEQVKKYYTCIIEMFYF